MGPSNRRRNDLMTTTSFRGMLKARGVWIVDLKRRGRVGFGRLELRRQRSCVNTGQRRVRQ
jgi:hypothetical protein